MNLTFDWLQNTDNQSGSKLWHQSLAFKDMTTQQMNILYEYGFSYTPQMFYMKFTPSFIYSEHARMLFCTILTHVQFQYWMTGIKIKILVTSWSCSQAWQGFSDSPNGDVNINEQLSETICLLFIFLFFRRRMGCGVLDLLVTVSNSMPHI